MSLATLSVHDTCRTGVFINFIQANLSPDGVYHHPFHWNDHYWKPEPLTEETINKTVDAANACVEAIHDPGVALNTVLNACIEYNRLLQVCVAEIKSDPDIDFVEVLLLQISKARMECTFNIGVVWMLAGLKQRNKAGNGVLKLRQAAAIFDHLLNADFRVDSEKFALSPDYIRVMAAMSMACAYELSLQFHMKDNFLVVDQNSQMAHRANFYFTIAAAIVTKSQAIPERDAVLNFCLIKRDFYEGFTMYLMSTEVDTNKGQSRRRKAIELFESSLEHVLRFLPGDRKHVEIEIRGLVDKCLKYKRMLRKGRIPEAMFATQRRRSAAAFPQMPTDIEPQFPPELKFLLGEEDEEEGTLAKRKKSVIVGDGTELEAEQLVECSVCVDHKDLRMEQPAYTPSDVSGKFHAVSALLSVQGTKKALAPDQLSRTALVFVVDINYNVDGLRNQMKEMVAFALRSAQFDAEDRIGFVLYKDDGSANPVQLLSGTPENIISLSDAVIKSHGNGKHQGSKGTSIASGVFAGFDALKELNPEEFPCREVIVVSDGWDNMLRSDQMSWDLVMQRAPELDSREIPVHTFAATTAADTELLRALSRRSAGNHGTHYRLEEEGVNSARNWVCSVLADTKQRLASLIEVTVKVPKGVLIGNVQSAKLEDIPTDGFNKLTDTATAKLPALAVDEASNVVITYMINTDAAKSDVVRLGTVEVAYANAIISRDGESSLAVQQTRTLEVENVCAQQLIDRENYYGTEMLFIDEVKGTGTVRTPVGGKGFLRGGEVVCPCESIFTEEGTLTLASVEATKIELSPNTDLAFDTINRKRIEMRLGVGAINVKTTSTMYVDVEFGNGIYNVTVAPSSAARISFIDGTVHVNTILGKATIATENEEKVRVYAPKQTSCRAPNAPAIPWAITDDVFDSWISTENATAAQLRVLIAIHTVQCRLIMARALLQTSRYVLRQIRVGTLTQNKANKRCRTFLIFHLLQEAKLEVGNSVAYATVNERLDMMRHQFERAVEIGLPRNRYSLSLVDVATLNEIAACLSTERTRGSATGFRTVHHTDLVKSLLNAKEREALAIKLAQEAAKKESRDAEQLRRREMIVENYSEWDFGIRNAIETRNIKTVFYSLPRQYHLVNIVLSRWEEVCRVTQIDSKNSALSDDQFVTVMMYLTSPLESFEFNGFMQLVSDVVQRIFSKIDESRITRSLHCLYEKFDPSGDGRVGLKTIVANIHKVIGDDLAVFKRVERLTTFAIEETNELMANEIRKTAATDDGTETESNAEMTTDTMRTNETLADTRGDGSESEGEQQPPKVKEPTEGNDYEFPQDGEKKPEEEKQPEAEGDSNKEDEKKPAENADEPESSPKEQADTAPASPTNAEKTDADKDGAEVSEPKEEEPKKPEDESDGQKPASGKPPTPSDDADGRQSKSGSRPVSRTSRPTSAGVRPATPLRVTTSTIADVPLTLPVFVHAFRGFLDSNNEDLSQDEILKLYNYRVQINPIPQEIDDVMRRERKTREKEHLQLWELRHIFDGVSRKHLQKLLAPTWTPPENIQEIAAPVCILTGLTRGNYRPHRDDNMQLISKSDDTWAVLRKILRRDAMGFFKFLENFPILSVSHRQTQALAKTLTEPQFDPSVLLRVSPVLSALCSWTRTALRICFLEHEHEVPAKICPRLLSNATASHYKMLSLTEVSALPKIIKPQQESNIQDLQRGFVNHYRGVFRAPPKIGYGQDSRFTPLQPAQPLVTSTKKAPRVQSAPAQRSPMPVLSLASPVRAAAELVPAAGEPLIGDHTDRDVIPVTPKRPQSASIATPSRLSSMARPSSAYVRAATRTLDFRPGSASRARASPSMPLAPSPPPQPRQAFGAGDVNAL